MVCATNTNITVSGFILLGIEPKIYLQ